MIYTSYYNNRNKGDGIYLAISRYFPKWLDSKDYEHLPELSPSDRLREQYKNGEIDFDTFIEMFSKEITINEIKILVDKIQQGIREEKDIYLCCHEKNLDNCHRYYFYKLLKDNNIDCEEY